MNSNDAEVLRNKLNRHASNAKSNKRRITRAGVACINCRRKKIRCNVQISDGTCTNCSLDDITCQTHLYGSLIVKPDSQETSDLLSCPHLNGSHDITCNVGEKEESSLHGVSIPSPRDVENGVQFLNAQFDSSKPNGLRKYLVGCFLQFIYPTFPVITFFQMAGIAGANEGNVPSCGQFVLNAFLATSIRFGDRKVLGTYGIHSKERAFDFFYSNAKVRADSHTSASQLINAQSLFPPQMNERSYAAIQGLLLMGYCETNSSQDTFFWLGMAHAVAVSLRLDNEPANIPQPERGLRKRLWWCLFSQLTLLEFTTGSAPYIQTQHATVCVLNYEDFESTIPCVLSEDVRKFANLHNGRGPLGIGNQFLNLLDFFQAQQGFSSAKFSKDLDIRWGIKAPPHRTHGACNHKQSDKDSHLAESLEAETQSCTFLPPEDDPENADLLYGMEQKLFDSIFASGENISKNERLDLYQTQDYFGDSGPANEVL